MSLEIEIVSSQVQNYIDTPYVVAKIDILKKFTTELNVAVNFWSEEVYQKHWKDAIDRIKKHDSACLVTSVHSPILSSPFIFWWALYKNKDEVHIYPEIIQGDDYKQTIGDELFSPENCHDFIGSQEVNDDGSIGSKWVVPVGSL